AITFLLLILQSATTQAGQKIRVYFIGNSYTYTNNLPLMLQNIAASMGDTLYYEEHDPGGWTFSNHADPTQDAVCTQKIKNGNWDYIILQEQSQLPSFPDNQFFPESFQYAYQLDTLIDNNNPCASTMFYMTWGYENGDASNCAFFPPVCTYEGMDSLLRLRYQLMADSLHELVAPVGAVRHYIRHHYPAINLYQPDGSHPTVSGTYAAATTFYASIFRKDPQLIPFNATLSAAEADSIKAAAKRVAFDSLSQWNLNTYDFAVAFSYAQTGGGNQISFTSNSINAVSYLWDFGDGNTSTQQSPTHVYTSTGTYNVRLIIFNSNNSCSRKATETVVVTTTGIDDIEAAAFSIAPNPANDELRISSPLFKTEKLSITVTDVQGRVLYHQGSLPKEEQRINITNLPPALYFISIANSKDIRLNTRFLKQ
ncbi:MAG TPA: PKD domain-containing protein, partial [Flavipsychrobacter sp.]|nr:PKD domain-containing protein [Flavipsychrobacter sp.]